MWRPSLVGIVIVILSPLSFGGVDDQVFRASAEGSAPGPAYNARGDAILNAQREIVVQYLETHVRPEHFTHLKPMLANAPSYMQSFTVLDSESKANLTTVKIEAVVHESALRRDMMTLLLPHVSEQVRVAALAVDLGAEGGEPSALETLAQTELTAMLEEKGLTVAPQEEVRPFHDRGTLKAAVSGNLDLANRVARTAFSHIGVMCAVEAEAVLAAPNSNVLKTTVSVTLRMYDTDAGELKREFLGKSAVEGANPEWILRQAVEDALAKFRTEVLTETALACIAIEPAANVRISIRGLPSEAAYNEIGDWLAAQLGEGGVERLHYGTTESRFWVHYNGPIARLADALTTTSFQGTVLDIDRAIGRDMALAVRGQ